jgi:uncharacterized membrane protein YqjE
MNKTVMFVVFALLAVVGLGGSVVLLIVRPDATATFTSLLVTVLGLVISAAGTIYALGKQNETIQTIQKQTNGNLSAKEKENERLTNILISAGIDPTGEHSDTADVIQSGVQTELLQRRPAER